MVQPQQTRISLEMDLILRWLVLYVVCPLAQSQLQVTITPSVIDVEDGVSVTVRCSLNLTHYKTNRVFSIMLKRGSELLVVYGYDKSYMPGKHYTVHGVLDRSKEVNFLQVKLENVTCVERGDYSCKMAVRLNSGNANFGPTSSPLKVIGAPTPIEVRIQKSNWSTAVGQAVNITCSALKKTKGSEWLWTFKDVSIQMSESCTYKENVCLFSCSSSMSYTVDDVDQSNVKCGYGGMIKRFSLNSTTNVDKEMETANEEEISTVEVHVAAVMKDAPTKRPQAHDNYTTYDVYPNPYGNGQRKQDLLKNILVYSFISVFVLLFLVILWLFISDRRRCRRFRKSGHFIKFEKDSENISEWTGGAHYPYPDTDTRLLHQQVPAYVAGHSTEDSTLLHHQIHHVNRPLVGSRSTNLPSNNGHGTQHFSETNYITPHYVGIASTDGHCMDTDDRDMPHHVNRACINGHCVNAECRDMPHHLDRRRVNGHCKDRNFMNVLNHVDIRHLNETSTDRNPGLSAEHIYDEVDDIRHCVGVTRGPVNNVCNPLGMT